MPQADVRGLIIEYEEAGDPNAPALLLINGLGQQLVGWDDDFFARLADLGFRVIRFDNRDVGLTTKLTAAGLPDMSGIMSGDAAPAYALDDMAADAAGLLEFLGIRSAHVIGVSMGGMIAQLLAINHPDRVLTLTSIMSDTGGRQEPSPTPEVLGIMLTPPPERREERIEFALRVRRALAGSAYPFDEDRERERARVVVDRSFSPDGTARQYAAILAARNREEELGRLSIPVLVIHGDEDPLIRPEHGRRTAAAVPGSELIMLPGVGHEIPTAVWEQVIGSIATHTARAPRRRPLIRQALRRNVQKHQDAAPSGRAGDT
jgi:pimeloyl-ACP methyl ester carboxylesterase